MSTRSILVTTCAAAAVLLAGCGGGGAPGNAAPVALGPAGSTDFTGAGTFDIVLQGSDANGDPLTFFFSDLPQDADVTWGTLTTDDTDLDPDTWTVVFDTTSSSHDGVEWFKYRVFDGIAYSAWMTVYMGIDNLGPDGADWGEATTEDTGVMFALDGVADQNTPPDALLYTIVTPPAHGDLSALPTTLESTAPTVTYTPDLNYPPIPVGTEDGTNNIDTFTFTVSDMVAAPVSFTVTITFTAVNDPPVLSESLGFIVPAGGTKDIIQLSATDPDNDPLTYTITALNLPAGGTLYDGPNATGTVIGAVPHTVTDPNDQLSFTAPEDVWGKGFGFTLQVSDGQGGTDTVEVTIEVLAPPCSCWGWGSNLAGQLGIGEGHVGHEELTPYKLEGDDWQMAVGGQSHSVFLSESGQVRTCGDNYNGQLGVGQGIYREAFFVSPEDFSAGVWVAAGEAHTIVAGKDGSLMSVGRGDTGQLGIGTMDTVWEPVEVTFRDDLDGNGNVILPPPNIVMVAAGNYHSLALDDAGDVWAFGNNSNNQLGIGVGLMRQLYAVKVEALDGAFIEFIAAGGNHSMAISSTGMLYTWGEGTAGQSGDGGNHDADPVQGILSPCIWAACGQKHSLAVTAAGALWAWGDNTYGQYGNDDAPNDYNYPVGIDTFQTKLGVEVPAANLVFQQVAAGGGYHSLALAYDTVLLETRVFACGKNDLGQVGIGSADDQVVIWTEVNFANDVLWIGAGYNHSFAIMEAQ